MPSKITRLAATWEVVKDGIGADGLSARSSAFYRSVRLLAESKIARPNCAPPTMTNPVESFLDCSEMSSSRDVKPLCCAWCSQLRESSTDGVSSIAA